MVDVDAEWKRIQEKTFTRWCNQQLKVQGVTIDSLSTDFGDGVKLIVLLEVLSQKKIGRYNKKPRVHAQKMENVQLVLDFITKKEKIRLVNIGSGDIVNGNLKLILGLVWTLILHYQISMGFQIDDPNTAQKEGPTARQALLNYVREKLPDKTINNLTTDWNDGTLVAALVDAHAPGLCPEAATMDPQNALENASHAMKLAEDWLDVPQVLMPEDMTNPNVDELSMMTYLSQYPDAKLKPGAPIKSLGDPSKVKVYGPGVKKDGLDTTVPSADFTVDARDAGSGAVSASCTGPRGPVKVDVKDNGDGTYSCSYEPRTKGPYVVKVGFNGQPVKDSPFHVDVASGSDPGKVKVTGPGLDGCKVGEKLVLDIDTRGAGDGNLALSLSGPVEAPVKIDDHHDGTATMEITPPEAGEYKLDIKYGDQEVPGAPFTMQVYDPSKVKAYGPGITGDGARVGQPAEVFVDARDTGLAPMEVQVTDPAGEMSTVELSPTEEKGVFSGSYCPKDVGTYGVEVKFGGEQIPDSPFSVPIGDPAKVQLGGPGLEKAIKDADNVIDVFTEGAGPGEVGAEFQGPQGSQPVDCSVQPVSDNHYQLHYTPHDTGDYKVTVTYGGFPVEPKEKVVPCVDPSQVKVEGLQDGVLLGEPAQFTVDTTKAGPDGDVGVVIKDAEGTEVPTTVNQEAPGVYTVAYTPTKSGQHEVEVKFCDKEVEGSPFFQEVSNPGAVRAYGPGLEKATADEPAKFTVDASKAGDGALGLQIEGPADCDIECKDNEDGTFSVSYVAPRPGIYHVNLKFADKDVPGSPFEVECQRPPPDASKCLVAFSDDNQGLTVDAKNAGGTGKLEVSVCGQYVPARFVSVQHNGDYTFSVSYDIPEPGETEVSVKWHGQHLNGSPFTVITK